MNFNYDATAPVFNALNHPFANHPLSNAGLLKALDPVRFRKVVKEHKEKKQVGNPVKPGSV